MNGEAAGGAADGLPEVGALPEPGSIRLRRDSGLYGY